jgi:hypothetical protein
LLRKRRLRCVLLVRVILVHLRSGTAVNVWTRSGIRRRTVAWTTDRVAVEEEEEEATGAVEEAEVAGVGLLVIETVAGEQKEDHQATMVGVIVAGEEWAILPFACYSHWLNWSAWWTTTPQTLAIAKEAVTLPYGQEVTVSFGWFRHSFLSWRYATRKEGRPCSFTVPNASPRKQVQVSPSTFATSEVAASSALTPSQQGSFATKAA